MVRVSCILASAIVAAADDSISMLQTDRKVQEHSQHQVCTGVKKGNVAPIDGLFNGRKVEIGEVAQQSGTFCVEKVAFALVQRTYGVSSVQDIEKAVDNKDNGENVEKSVSSKGGSPTNASTTTAALTTAAPTTAAPTTAAPTTAAPTTAAPTTVAPTTAAPTTAAQTTAAQTTAAQTTAAQITAAPTTAAPATPVAECSVNGITKGNCGMVTKLVGSRTEPQNKEVKICVDDKCMVCQTLTVTNNGHSAWSKACASPTSQKCATTGSGAGAIEHCIQGQRWTN